jgi:hypothetical protein
MRYYLHLLRQVEDQARRAGVSFRALYGVGEKICRQQRHAPFLVTIADCNFLGRDLKKFRSDIAMTFGPALRIAGLPDLPPGLNRGAALADRVISVAGRIFLRTRLFPLGHYTVSRFAV